MAWCESNAVTYILGLSGNGVLNRLVEPVADAAPSVPMTMRHRPPASLDLGTGERRRGYARHQWLNRTDERCWPYSQHSRSIIRARGSRQINNIERLGRAKLSRRRLRYIRNKMIIQSAWLLCYLEHVWHGQSARRSPRPSGGLEKLRVQRGRRFGRLGRARMLVGRSVVQTRVTRVMGFSWDKRPDRLWRQGLV